MLRNDRIRLRAVEPEDVDYLYEAENDSSLWYVSDTLIPFSRNTLKKYAESVHDILAQGQFRFIIETLDTQLPIGMVDLFDYNQMHKRAGVGIVVTDLSKRKTGMATDALELVINYSRKVLKLHQLYCSMHKSNESSEKLFKKVGFKKVGERKDWYLSNDGWEDEIQYQLIMT